MKRPDRVGNKPTMCVHIIYIIVYIFVYMFALAYLCRCAVQLAQLWPNRSTQPTKKIMFSEYYLQHCLKIPRLASWMKHMGFFCLFDMIKRQLRFNLWAWDVQVLSCSLPAVKNVFSYEIASWFEWMERIIGAVSAMGDNDELSLHVFLKILILRARQMVFTDLLFA